MNQVWLDGTNLTRQQFLDVVLNNVKVTVHPEALKKVAACREKIEEIVERGDIVYGVTTGFGKLSDVVIEAKDVTLLQENLLRSHAVGVGNKFSTEVVRGMLLLRANALAKGHSGIRPQTLELLVEMLNRGVHPQIPSQGSLGASGDLAPLAHMALVLIGEGYAEFEGTVTDGAQALARAGLQSVALGAKEGLALINGTQAMTSVGLLAVMEAERIGYAADAAAGLTMEALRGIRSAFAPELMALRPHPGAVAVAERILCDLNGSARITEQGEIRVQDAYSIRCIPQVHGASWTSLQFVMSQLDIEMNAATDNPLVLEDCRILSGGHFHGQPIALAMDFLKLAVAEWANISERRTERLVNPGLSGLNPFLAGRPGLESGLMIAQYVAAALVSENKVLAHPASVDSIPSSANQEDHVSMGTISARQVRDMIRNSARVVAIELICASQAIAVQQADGEVSPTSRQRLERVRSMCPVLQDDRSISANIDRLAEFILTQQPAW